ncbi:hypothetical protein KC967_03610 [Candidatus Saccharibacteria bacterium]|nr:hypothetical protein [Candidatus Saccharibacteria bacterium]
MALRLSKGTTRSYWKSLVLSFTVMALALQPLLSMNIPAAFAAPDTVYANTGFNGLTWGADRTAPSGGYTKSSGTLTMNVDGSKPNANQDFYKYEGLIANLPSGTNSVRANLYVDPSWQSHDVIVGMWGHVEPSVPVVGANADIYNPSWPTFEFSNLDTGNHTATVDVWNTFDGALYGVTNVNYGTNLTFELKNNPVAGTFEYYLNDSLVYSQPSKYTVTAGDLAQYPNSSLVAGQVITYNKFSDIIFNNRNAGTNYQVKWSNLQLGRHQVHIPNATIDTPRVSGVVAVDKRGGVLPITGSFTDQVAPNYLQFELVYQGNLVKTGIVYGSQVAADGKYSYNMPVPTGLASGEYSLFYTGTNFQGGVGPRLERKFFIDNTAPTGTVTIPAAGSTVSVADGNLAVTGTVNENIAMNRIGVQLVKKGVSGQVQYLYANNNQLYGTNPTTWSAEFHGLNLADGAEYGINLSLIDQDGNVTNNPTQWFKVDNTKPVAPTGLAWKTSIGGNITNNGATNLVGGTALWQASASSDVDHYVYKYWNDIAGNQYKVGSEYIQTTSGVAMPGVFNQGEGVHHFSVTAVDHAGNESAPSNFAITYDTTAPAVVITGAQQNSNNTISFTGNVSDTNLNYYYCWLTHQGNGSEIDGTRNSNCVTKWAGGQTNMTGTLGGFDASSLATGVYTIHLAAVDKAGNVTGNDGSVSYDIAIDHTAPVITITGVTRNSDGSYTITGTSDDRTPVTVSVGGVSYPVVTPNGSGVWTATTTPLEAGESYAVTVSSTDAAGNTGNSTPAPFTFTTPTTPLGDTGANTEGAVAPAFVARGGNQGQPLPLRGLVAPAGALAVNDGTPATDVVAAPTDTKQSVLGASTDKSAEKGDVLGVTDTRNSTFGLLGFAWYWWLAALAVLGGLWWFIAARRRRKEEEEVSSFGA